MPDEPCVGNIGLTQRIRRSVYIDEKTGKFEWYY